MKSLIFGSILFLVGCSTVVPDEPLTEKTDCDAVYDPVCAEIQVQCITTPCDPIQETVSNACEAEKRGLKIVYNGECKDALDMPAGNFEFNDYGNFYGEVFVKGYIQTKSIPEAFCEEPCETRYEGVFFHVVETGNSNFGEFLKKNRGNAYIGETSKEELGSIMLGCIEEEQLKYSNDSDEHGMASLSWTKDQTQELLNYNSPGRRGVLKLTKLPLSGGRGAPACYSHFYGIELFN